MCCKGCCLSQWKSDKSILFKGKSFSCYINELIPIKNYNKYVARSRFFTIIVLLIILNGIIALLQAWSKWNKMVEFLLILVGSCFLTKKHKHVPSVPFTRLAPQRVFKCRIVYFLLQILEGRHNLTVPLRTPCKWNPDSKMTSRCKMNSINFDL